MEIDLNSILNSLPLGGLGWVFVIFLLSLFHEDRMRFGKDKSKNSVFLLPLHSPFAIFAPC